MSKGKSNAGGKSSGKSNQYSGKSKSNKNENYGKEFMALMQGLGLYDSKKDGDSQYGVPVYDAAGMKSAPNMYGEMFPNTVGPLPDPYRKNPMGGGLNFFPATTPAQSLVSYNQPMMIPTGVYGPQTGEEYPFGWQGPAGNKQKGIDNVMTYLAGVLNANAESKPSYSEKKSGASYKGGGKSYGAGASSYTN